MIAGRVLPCPRLLALAAVVALWCFLPPALELRAESLPQEQEYQRVLRHYLASLSEQDLAVPLRPWNESQLTGRLNDLQLFRLWMLTLEKSRFVEGLKRPAAEFTLAAIEGSQAIMRPAADPMALAWLATWQHPGNPYYLSRGLIHRALVCATVDLIMTDFLHHDITGWEIKRADFLSGTMIWIAYVYHTLRPHLPKEVAEAYHQGLANLVETLDSYGPTGMMTDMDLFATVSLAYVAQSTHDDQLKAQATGYARNLFTNPRFFNPAGYFVDLGCFDASYNGISLYFAVYSALTSRWDFALDAVRKAYDLRAHLSLPEPDGLLLGPSHFSSRTSGDSPHDQWQFGHRHYGAAMISEQAYYLTKAPTRAELRRDLSRWVNQLNQEQQSAADRPPAPWSPSHWTQGINYAYEYFDPAFFTRRGQAEHSRSALLLPPFQRPGTFIRAFDQAFTIAKFPRFGLVIHSGPVGGGLYGFGGGALSAFWTPGGGSFILGRRRGTQGPVSDAMEDWQLWPTHALSGEMEDGSILTSAKFRNLQVTQNLEKDSLQVIVQHQMPSRVRALGEPSQYTRRFFANATGLDIKTTFRGSGEESAKSLYEIIPLFLKDAQRQPKLDRPQIALLIDSRWVEATSQFQENVAAVGVRRFKDQIKITFDRPRRVALSARDYDDQYMSRVTHRNLLIDVLENAGQPKLLGEASIQYRISN